MSQVVLRINQCIGLESPHEECAWHHRQWHRVVRLVRQRHVPVDAQEQARVSRSRSAQIRECRRGLRCWRWHHPTCGWRRLFQEVRCLTDKQIRAAVDSNDPTIDRWVVLHLGAIIGGISVQPGHRHLLDAGRLVELQPEGFLRCHRTLSQRRFSDQQEHSLDDP